MRSPAEIHDLSLREAIGDFVSYHVRAAELADVLPLLDRVGFASIDAFGGTTFLPTMKILGEDPWERLRAIRRSVTATPLQAVLRGQFVFSSRRAPASTIRATLQHLRNLGVDRIKVVDLGLDHAGAQEVVAMAKDLGFGTTATISIPWGWGGAASAGLCRVAAGYVSAGADAIGLQDPFGALNPVALRDLVRRYVADCAVPLRLHLHDANLMAVAGVHAGLQAGARAVDTTVSALSWAYSPPPAEAVLMALRGGPFEPAIDVRALEAAAAWFEELKAKKGFLYRELYGVDHTNFRGELPAAVRRALEDELRERGRADLGEAAWRAVPSVWTALGRPPLLNPLVRAICSQAIEDVLSGSPFARLDPKVSAFLRGDFGPPGPEARSDLVKRAEAEEPREPALLPDVNDLDPVDFASEDDRLTYALFPKVAGDFFRLRASGGQALPEVYPSAAQEGAEAAPTVPRRLVLKRHGEAHEVVLEGMGPQEWGKRTFFVRIGAQLAHLEVALPEAGAPPVYTVIHHGRRHRVEFVEVCPPGRASVPVLLREDGNLHEVLYAIPRPVRWARRLLGRRSPLDEPGRLTQSEPPPAE